MVDLTRLRSAYYKVKDELLSERTPEGHWVGELSSSALSTATAISALAVARGRGQESGTRSQDLIRRGIAWLVVQQNEDGGFGDTDLSHSNIATTYLVVAALHLAGAAPEHANLIQRANAYIETKGGLSGLRERYGIDKTFVVPIMTNLALAGLVDWREIDPLPFELACVPQSLYRFVGMPVVSYAIPALVAIGQAHYFHARPRNPITRLIRQLSIHRSLRVLRRMQPESGGYLEATPLTSFVVMSLASAGKYPIADDVIRAGVKFLVNSMRPDGSWPIDTNLATWNTTLAINALAGGGEDLAALLTIDPETLRTATDAFMRGSSATAEEARRGNVLAWFLSCQHQKRHPFTGASAGGFGWSNLTGAVPDVDDTAGAVLALGALVTLDQREEGILRRLIGNSLCFYALGWLSSLQNRDGGWPTFCRGWGKLPFDRSGTDLTAHTLRSLAVTAQRFQSTGDEISAKWMQRLLNRVSPRALAFITSSQHSDGSWSPLWFGNQDHPSEDNPVYGTAKVLMVYRDLDLMDASEAQRGVEWLLANQNEDGGWGSGVWRTRNVATEVTSLGEPVLSTQSSVRSTKSQSHRRDALVQTAVPSPQPLDPSPFLQSSIEETALAVEALLATVLPTPDSRSPTPDVPAALDRGLAWLLERVERGEHRHPAPIGFYFAKLWYYERLYPLTFTVAALGRALRTYTRLSEVENDPPQALRTP